MRVAAPVVLALACLLSWAAAADAATVGYWRCDEGSGTTLEDASPQSNDGALLNGAFYTSNVAYSTILEAPNPFSIELDGVNDSGSVPDSAALDLGAAFTVEAFVRRAGGDDTLAGVVVKRNVAGNSPSYGLVFGSAAGIRASAQVASPGSIGTATFDLAAGVWYHVAAVYDGATLRLYVDGDLKASVAGSGSVEASTHPLEIGSFGDFFQGRIDEVRISNVALTPEQFLRAPIFADGFESGDTGDWSFVDPS